MQQDRKEGVIRQKYKNGIKQKELSNFYNVNQSCISRIINYRRRES